MTWVCTVFPNLEETGITHREMLNARALWTTNATTVRLSLIIIVSNRRHQNYNKFITLTIVNFSFVYRFNFCGQEEWRPRSKSKRCAFCSWTSHKHWWRHHPFSRSWFQPEKRSAQAKHRAARSLWTKNWIWRQKQGGWPLGRISGNTRYFAT